ncbi:MAG: GyrI-like domain-containing protein [Candidatus Thorarchaeota archaeon]|jgi:DNA gyrase inhibitor GyrI/DNA-binding transcriptional ArsR family regulator
MSEKDPDTIRNILTKSKDDIALVLSSLANSKRLQIMQLLLIDRREFIEMQDATGLSKTALVHHLNKLVESGAVNHVERGLYEVSEDGLKLLQSIVVTYIDTTRLRKLETARRADYIERLHSKSSDEAIKEAEIRIVELPPMRVAAIRAISKTPENDAWTKMRAWAQPKGLLDDLDNHPVFGFNNPDPTPGKEEYGYEFWIRIGPDIEEDGEVEIKDYEGGRHAVTTCNLKQEVESEFFKNVGSLESWRRLKLWLAQSKEYKLAKRPCLERALDPLATEDELILDLHMPIRRRGR